MIINTRDQSCDLSAPSLTVTAHSKLGDLQSGKLYNWELKQLDLPLYEEGQRDMDEADDEYYHTVDAEQEYSEDTQGVQDNLDMEEPTTTSEDVGTEALLLEPQEAPAMVEQPVQCGQCEASPSDIPLIAVTLR